MQTLIFHPEAKAEMRQAANWYEDRRRGLAEIFITAGETAVQQIQLNPYSRMKIRNSARRMLLKKFPYGIIYLVEEDTIFILAVMHLRRHPDYWVNRLDDLQF